MKIYNNPPQVGQLVNITILNNNMNNNYFDVNLNDYGLKGIINISNLTLKKKIRNINNIAPLYTTLPAIVDSINKVISVSRLNIDTNSELYKNFIIENESNKLVRSFVISSAIKTKMDEQLFLDKVVYIIDNDRKEGNLYDNIIKKIKGIRLKKSIKKIIIPLLKEKNITKQKLYKTNIGLIAKSSLNDMIEQIKNILVSYKELQLKLVATPTYNIISDYYYMTKHKEFIKELQELKEPSFNLKVF